MLLISPSLTSVAGRSTLRSRRWVQSVGQAPTIRWTGNKNQMLLHARSVKHSARIIEINHYQKTTQAELDQGPAPLIAPCLERETLRSPPRLNVFAQCLRIADARAYVLPRGVSRRFEWCTHFRIASHDHPDGRAHRNAEGTWR